MEQIFTQIMSALNQIYSISDFQFIVFLMIITWLTEVFFCSVNVFPKIKLNVKTRWILLFTMIWFSLFYRWLFIDSLNLPLQKQVQILFTSNLFALFLNVVVGFDKILNKIFNVQLKELKPEERQIESNKGIVKRLSEAVFSKS